MVLLRLPQEDSTGDGPWLERPLSTGPSLLVMVLSELWSLSLVRRYPIYWLPNILFFQLFLNTEMNSGHLMITMKQNDSRRTKL
jgi:hypothetical protein